MSIPIFSRHLQQSPSPAHMLNALKSLHHVVYLENNNQPFIAFNAIRYQLIQNHHVHNYHETVFNSYNPSNDSLNINFNHNQSKNSLCKYVGFVGYDYAANQNIDAELHPQPAFFLGEFLSFLRFEHDVWIFESSHPNAEMIFDTINDLINSATITEDFKLDTPCTARWNKAQYSAAFQKVQDYIVAGDCYQINLTQEFKAKATGSLLTTAAQFWQLTNAPYAGYLRIADFELLSCSPELFIDFLPNRKIITKPIKGTMPRYSDPLRDEQSKHALKNSEKDMAENVMIVDLLRNDLSVYAEIGTVKTPKLFNIESFNQVHHMVSEVEATLKAEINPFDVLMSALPGGSITGAPKIRAMQIIKELEGAPRGAYCGSMGYFNADGTGAWNILIRSIQKYQDDVSLWAGGGITIASDCDAEYQECFDKVEAMLNLLNTWYTPE
ncbi:aminobenzoate synthetase [Acinetobacter sp. NCu2D-2]|uniref:anthranilate synthase component I family protein n=1 Tax=Acinetobacter sp. NCu2D-2 TaxID=1608473 RepID=UPI0007CDA797|nr:anthranilate synthase component I family protein [Acinetobacter sp. NCu2D-2]ANF81130.1 aminobenzoate synthetase [Acinetobacter sp. NCu2D-2]